MKISQVDKREWYNNLWVRLLVLFAFIFIVDLVSKKDKPDATKPVQTEVKQVTSKTEDIPKDAKVTADPLSTLPADETVFKEYISYATGNPFIKSVSIKDNNVLILYYGSYSDYKEDKPDSLVKNEDYSNHLGTENAIQKILVGESARLLRQFHDLNAVSMILPFDGKTYSMDVDRNSLNKFLGYKIESLSIKDGTWNDKFSDLYIYDKSNRQKFFDTFVKIN
ncbi:hypothetical protein J2T18_001942 [Paenibacillus polymyxa]|uniref:hypothetical protein n=1 Tax=Paenibacillus polymyxa TaxID=1406 RepID=UPI0027905F9C|nr:hypothetical protein [Paenibacillus polymyxa]MDQ0047659.1 hypothetical protein [Paenibacillus polymyxa]